jgi:hypothetical protein
MTLFMSYLSLINKVTLKQLPVSSFLCLGCFGSRVLWVSGECRRANRPTSDVTECPLRVKLSGCNSQTSDMAECVFAFTTTRDVPVKDLSSAIDSLCTKGLPAEFLKRPEGGIDLRNKRCQGPDVCFIGSGVLRDHKDLHDMEQMDCETVFISHIKGLEPFDPRNQFVVVLRDRTQEYPTPEAMAALLQAKPHIISTIQVCFDALPHVIQHENRTVMSSDDPWHVNLHAGFDYLKAYQKYTKPSAMKHDVSFECFLCGHWRHELAFIWAVHGEDVACNLTPMQVTLRSYHLGTPACCHSCMLAATHKRKR